MAAIIPIKYYNTYVLKKLVQPDVSSSYNWFVEESRIRGGYNNVQTGLSPRAFLASDDNKQEVLANSIIYSGVFNSRTGINQVNQFPSGQDITRTVDPGKGSIQKLYAEDTNLIIFQEEKVNKALIDKDAVYTQEGQPIQTASNVVIGGIVPYAGEFGIARNPESFAVYGYRKYFTDAAQGAVLRLSQDGITEISNYGMYDFFRDKFATLAGGTALGAWDIHNKCYTLSLNSTSATITTETLSFDEQVRGWTSRYSFEPSTMFSIQNKFYSTSGVINFGTPLNSNFAGAIYEHYAATNFTNRANFYEIQYDSTIKTIFNTNPSLIKSFKTINYEGASNSQMTSLVTNSSPSVGNTNQYTDSDTSVPIGVFSQPLTLVELEDDLFKNNFKQKEDKYFANILNTSAVTPGEVLFGQSISGVKGFFATVDMKATNTATSGSNELFSIALNYNESSY